MADLSIRALLFDLNGTMIDDMAFHTQAWFDLLNKDLSKPMSREEVRSNMYGTNAELLARVFGPSHFSREEAEQISMKKERRYQEAFLPHLKLINGLDALIKKGRKSKIKIGMGTAAIPFNVDFVLDKLQIRHYFDAIVTADDVARSKPDPETYLKLADKLGVAPVNCLVFEDAPKGMEAAARAGMPGIALLTMHSREEFTGLTNIRCFVRDFTEPCVEGLPF